jgi:CheY-specific phosphatase CheX
MADLNTVLNTAAEEVLGNMFFSGVTGEIPGDPEGERLCARVSFSGSSEGELAVSASASTLAVLAAGFLGEEDGAVSEPQVRSVAGELANVLCGAVLGHLNPKGSFRITPPRIISEESGAALRGMEFRRLFELMEGDLAVGLTVH